MLLYCPYNPKAKIPDHSPCIEECDKSIYCIKANQFSMLELVDQNIIIKGKKLICRLCGEVLTEDKLKKTDLFKIYKSGGRRINGIWEAVEMRWYQYFTFTSIHLINIHRKIPYDFPFRFPFVSRGKVFCADSSKMYAHGKIRV